MLLFAALLFGCFFYALAKGGWPERIGSFVLVVGSFLTLAVATSLQQRFASVEIGILVVDVAVLFAFLALALNTDRYWPLWTTALQLLVVLAHLARWADPGMFRHGYGFILAVWSYMQLLVMALGVRAHQKQQLRTSAEHF